MKRPPREWLEQHGYIQDAQRISGRSDMPLGAGKYDHLATHVFEHAEAETVLVIVLRGKHGDGFSLQTVDPASLAMVPDVLELVAAQIRRDQEIAQ